MSSRFSSSRRTLAISASAALVALGLVGCSADSSPSADQSSPSSGEEAVAAMKPLTVMSQWGADAEGVILEELIADYEKATGNTVELTVVAGDGADVKRTYEASVLAGEEPDVILTNMFASTVNWVSDGATVPVDKYLAEWGLDSVIRKGAVGVWDSPDGLRGFPYSGLQWPVWFNTALLEQAGVSKVPETTPELVSAAKKLRSSGIKPFAIGGNDWSGTKLFLQMVSGFLDEDSTKDLLTNGGFCENPAAMKGIDLVLDLVAEGVFVDDAQGLSYEQMTAMYQDGQAAIMYTGQWAFGGVTDELASTTTFTGFPKSPENVWPLPTSYNSENGVGLHISNNGAENIAAVEPFVKLLFSKEYVSAFAVRSSVVPVVEAEYVDPTGASDLFVQSVAELPTKVSYIPMPDDHMPGTVISAMPAAVSLAFTPGSDRNKVCSAVDSIYASAG